MAYGVRWLFELLLYPFDLLPAWLALTLISLLSGAGMLWVVGKTTSQKRIERARDRMASAVYEVRLFLDSPRRVFAAQGRLLSSGMLYVGLLMPALLVMTIPLGVLYLHLEPRYGIAPLAVGEPAVVRIDLADGVDGYAVEPEAEVAGFAITAPPLFVEAEHRVYLRVEVREPGAYDLKVRVGDHVVSKQLSADPDAKVINPERTTGLATLWAYGAESPLPSGGGVDKISVAYPARDQTWAWIAMPWWVYWLIVATVAAFALRKPMGVVI